MKILGLILATLVTLFQFCTSEQLLHSVDGTIGRGNYTYYSLMYDGPISLYLYSTEGDADLYVSQVISKPTFEPDTYCLQSSTCGLDIVKIPKDFNRPVGIGVYGHPSHEQSSFLLEVYISDHDHNESLDSFPDLNEEYENAESSNRQRDQDRDSVPGSYYTHDWRDSVRGSEEGSEDDSFLWSLLWSFFDVLVEVLFLLSHPYAAMLDYENQMFLDILNEDGLVVSAKGLGLENVFFNLLKVYSDPGNLVLVLGTSGEEEHYYISRLEEEGAFPLPKIITSESGSSAERMNLYLQGGVLFVSPRILVVDLLKDRLPVALVTGIMVYRAQSIIKSCQEAFAVRLYRQKNKTGFIKAFSNSAQAFTVGFAQVSRIMRMLFLKHLFLWPRFQAIVQTSLGLFKPKVVEMHVQLTPAMTRIQNAVLELMSFTVKELKRINPTMDFDELTVENAIAKSFHKILQIQLDPVWHQLSSKTKVLVSDLKILRVFLNYLTRYDCITFNTFVSSFRSQSYAVNSSGWLLLDSANVMFSVANERVVGEPIKAKKEPALPTKSSKKQDKPSNAKKLKKQKLQTDDVDVERVKPVDDDEKEKIATKPNKFSKLSLSLTQKRRAEIASCSQQNELLENLKKAVTPPKKKVLSQIVEDSDSEEIDEDLNVDGETAKDDITVKKGEFNRLGVNSEVSPKWMVLKQILTEIKDTSKSTTEDFSVRDKVLILVQDKRTAKQLQDFLVLGAQELLLKLYEKSLTRKLSYTTTAGNRQEPNAKSPTKLFQKYQPRVDEGYEMELNSQLLARHKRSEVESSPGEREGEKTDSIDTGEMTEDRNEDVRQQNDEEYRDMYVLTQKTDSQERKKNEESDGKYEVIANKLCDLVTCSADESFEFTFQSPMIIIQTFKTDGNPLSLPQILDKVKPRFIVMYDVDVSAIRRIELYQAVNPKIEVQVYFVVFGGSVEEQAYLTALRREKEAFEFLINEKATMVIPEDQDGKSDHCDALSRDVAKPNETVNTRKGGAYEEPQSKKQSTIVVDMREFNSELPSMIHRRGIDVAPVTLQIGDYILSPEICVERKSVNDLIGSLNHGRLYNQAKAMTRYYASPILLIEFDQNKPMTLQGNYYISNDMSSNDVSAKLILLTLHFPQLKIVWSPSPYATAQLFEELKQVREEPDPLKAAEIGADLEQDLDIAEKYNPGIHDLVARLPGITTKNVHSILNRGQSLDHLATLSQETLSDILGNSQEGQSLHDAFHEKFKPVDTTEGGSRRGGARWRGRGRGFKR